MRRTWSGASGGVEGGGWEGFFVCVRGERREEGFRFRG